MLPLDLHVLGLPLAFILSQDQTLRCKNFEFYLLARLFYLIRCFTFISQFSKNLFVILDS